MSRINFVLRAIILLYFYVHAMQIWQYALHIPLSLLLFVISYTLGVYVSYKILPPLSLYKRVLLYISFPVGMLFIRLLLWIVDFSRSVEYSSLLVEWDLTVYPMRNLLIGIFYSTIVFSKYRFYRIFELSLRPFFFVFIFWDMRSFQLSFYPSLLSLLLSLIFYSSLEVALLSRLLNTRQSTKHAFIITIKVMVFSAITSLLTVPWVYQKAKPHIRPSDGLLKFSLNNDFDFAEELTLESEISLGNRLLFLVRSDSILEHGLLLKRLTMSEYDPKRGFKRLAGVDDYPTARDGNYQEWVAEDDIVNYSNTLEFYLVNLSSDAILFPYNPISYNRLQANNRHQFKGIFRIDSYDINFIKTNMQQRKAIIGEHSLNNSAYLDISAVDNAIINLAKEITADIDSDYAKVLALESFFQENFYYTLTPGAPVSGDQLSSFLFHTRRGYCTYFASAMVLMARAVGLPARMAGGFLISHDNQLFDFYAVTAAQSHAWVEIYFDEVGWIPFDPTSSQLYNNELVLSDSDRTLAQARQLLESIARIELKPATTFMTQELINYTKDQLSNPQVKRNVGIFFSIFLVILLILNYLMRLLIIQRTQKLTMSTSRSHLLLYIRLWLEVLKSKQNKVWFELLSNDCHERNAVHRLLFDHSIALNEAEINFIEQYFKRCYEYLYSLSFSQRIQLLYGFSLWRFYRVLF